VCSCEKLVGSRGRSCYSYVQNCADEEGASCTMIRQLIAQDGSHIPRILGKFGQFLFFLPFEAHLQGFLADEVVSSVNEQALTPSVKTAVSCDFFNNDEFLCSFPFNVRFNNHQVHWRSAPGSFYTGRL
jgi:hypothetical protein